MSNQEVSRSEDVKYGRTTVGTSAVPISIRFTGDETEKLRRGFLVKAAPDNSATIFLGGPTVTAEDGMPLLPGESLSIPADKPWLIYAISTDSDQALAWIGD